MSEVIALRGLSHSYNETPVLRGIDLTVTRGEFVGLIGLSGAGKSTLLRCINGLIVPTGGTCRVLDQQVEDLSANDRRLLRRRIGMIFQEFNLVDRLTARKNVLIGRLAYVPRLASCLHHFPKSDVELATRSLADVGLAGYEYRRVREMSGGQKQRVAIARAMAQGADLILADEATANLDVLTKDEIMILLRELMVARDVTVLASMHDVDLAKRYCTRIIGLKGGRITFDAAPSDLDEEAVAEVMGRSPAIASPGT